MITTSPRATGTRPNKRLLADRAVRFAPVPAAEPHGVRSAGSRHPRIKYHEKK